MNGEQEGAGTFGSEEGWVYSGRWLHGRMNGEGHVKLPSGVCYSGEWVDGARTGVGRLSWPDGSWYEGQFKDNCIEGRGRKVLPNGSWFSGNFHDGQLTGTGTFHWADGNEFDGLWHNSEIVGPGCHRLPDETTIIGVFKDRGASGEGTKKWANGCTYTGRLLRNHIHQHGILKWPDGRQYVGNFLDEAMHGEGTLTWNDKDGLCKYKGRFEHNSFHGAGVLEWSNKARYVGQFQNGHYHGVGTFEWPDRVNVYRGQWTFGEMCGRGVLAAAGSDLCAENGGNAFVYMGEFAKGNMEGDGHVVFLGNGKQGPRDEYRGAFARSLFHGLGTFTWASGHSISGHFQEHRCSSLGCKVYPGGQVYYGELEDDLEHGKGVLTDDKQRLIGLWKNGKLEQELFETSVHALDLDAMPGEESQRVFGGLREAQSSRLSAAQLPSQTDATGKPLEDQAILLYLNGDKYFGRFKGGKKHGLGMYVYADLTAYKGQWDNDAFNGVKHPHPDKDRSEQVMKLHNLNEDNEVQIQLLKKFADSQGMAQRPGSGTTDAEKTK